MDLEAATQYVNWLKHEDILGARQLRPEYICEDLSNGLILLRVLERIYPHSVDWTKVNVPASSLFKKMDNCSLLASLCRDKGIPSEGILAQAIAEGKSDALLKTLWLLMRQAFVVLRGAKTEDEIRKMASQYTGAKRVDISTEELEPAVLWQVAYYGIEGEIFTVFCDEEDLDCDRLPHSFEAITKKPNQFSHQITHKPSINELSKSKSKVYKGDVEIRDLPCDTNRDTRIIPDISLHTRQTSIRMSFNEPSNHQPNMISMRPFFSQSRPPLQKSKSRRKVFGYELLDCLSDFEAPLQRDFLSKSMKADELENISIIPIPVKLPSTNVPRFGGEAEKLIAEHHQLLDSILLNNLEQKSPSSSQNLDIQSNLSHQHKTASFFSRQNSENQMVPGSSLHSYDLANFATDSEGFSKKEASEEPFSPKENGGPGLVFLSPEKSKLKMDNLCESEVIDEFDWSSSLHIFDSFASILRGMKALCKDKQIQRRSLMIQFSPQTHIPYRFRLMNEFGSQEILQMMKMHSRFTGYHYQELFEQEFDRSEMVDIRNEKQKVDLAKGKIIKILDKVGVSERANPLLQRAESVEELRELAPSLVKSIDFSQSSVLKKVLSIRLQYLANSSSLVSENLQKTSVPQKKENYLDQAIFRVLPPEILRLLYQGIIVYRLNDDKVAQKQFNKVGSMLPLFAKFSQNLGRLDPSAFIASLSKIE